MDIYTLIRNDHEAAKKIIGEINLLPVAHSASRFALFVKLKDAVLAHNDAEAGSFYVALEAYTPTRREAARSRKEHKEVAEALADLSDAGMPPANWEQKFASFQKDLLHHIEEEEGKVFDAARRVISPLMADELAMIMQRLKHEKEIMLRKAG